VAALAQPSDGKLLGIVHYLLSPLRAGRSATIVTCRICSWPRAARKLGLGRALIEAVYREARARAGASRVYWNTHETNGGPRGALYDTLAEPAGIHSVPQGVSET